MTVKLDQTLELSAGMIVLFDEQIGKLIAGYPKDVTDLQFTLVDERDIELGKFDISHLPADKRNPVSR